MKAVAESAALSYSAHFKIGNNERSLEKLKENGFEFENKADLMLFAMTRCTLEVYPNKLNILRADGKIICEWYDTHRFEKNGDVFSVIIGENPKIN
jgi:hypothetical protein